MHWLTVLGQMAFLQGEKLKVVTYPNTDIKYLTGVTRCKKQTKKAMANPLCATQVSHGNGFSLWEASGWLALLKVLPQQPGLWSKMPRAYVRKGRPLFLSITVPTGCFY